MKAVNKIGLAVLVIFISGCGSSGSDAVDSKLVGSWLLTHENQCQETTTYHSNGTWTNIALDEIQTGSYTFSDIASNDRHSLAVTIEGDNGLADCQGNSELDTGLSVSVFVSFPSDSIMEFYIFEGDASPFFTFTKQP